MAKLAIALLWALGLATAAAAEISFNQDIRPILAGSCYSCHGPDEGSRKADLRLDSLSGASRDLDGIRAIVPGDPEASELIARVSAADPDDRMPPEDHGEPVSASEIELLEAWIREGAEYETHWAFVPPTRPALPTVDSKEWPDSPLDFFTLAQMESHGLKPAPEASRATLLRRLNLDLIGLPPSPEDVQAFIEDDAPNAYERRVDALLASPAYGERWARIWLDLARYADSAGYGSDPLRIIWKYRDWVINAFNQNLPFDQFTLEQIAGDLLPDPTAEQLIATAFHRNTKTNTEGGTDDEEFRVEAVRDRVDTTFQVWMGVTAGCARCHTHKYDPISHKEYYQFYDYFNQTADADRPDEEPRLASPTPEQRARKREQQEKVDAQRSLLSEWTPELEASYEHWIQNEAPKHAASLVEAGPWSQIGPFPSDGFDDAHGKNFINPSEVDLEKTYEEDSLEWTQAKPEDGYFAFEGDASASYVYRRISSDRARNIYIQLGSDDSLRVWLNGQQVLDRRITREAEPAQETLRLDLKEGDNELLIKVANYRDESGLYFHFKEINANPKIDDTLTLAAEERSEEGIQQLRQVFLNETPLLRDERDKLAQLESQLRGIDRQILRTPIMRELPEERRRESYIMVKGSFLNKGDVVEAATPEFLHPMPEEAPDNRLGVAQWLTSPENPLSARVAANRIWARLFGKGLVVTEEDFGSQGELPSHPKLLDWLALHYQDDLNWDTKEFLKSIVMSSTYRQSSRAPEEKLAKDPENTWLSRAPRFRLEAELIRDQALAISGALDNTIGGPSVYPPQPDGIWRPAFNGQRTWPTSEGGDRYRRGIYTYLRRTAPYPSMVTFDAPSREVCTVRRSRTNTPLQSFVTLNDPAFVETAQALALRLLTESNESPKSIATRGLWLALCRQPNDVEVESIVSLYQEQLKVYQDDPVAAEEAMGRFKESLLEHATAAEAAAWTVVGNVLLNLDAVLTRG